MKKMKPIQLLPFDSSRYLKTDSAIADYISAALEEGDSELLLVALSNVARARGMAQVAADADLGRESLYKALSPGAKPRFDTIFKVMRALGIRLKVEAA